MIKKLMLAITLPALFLGAATASAQVVSKQALTLEAAKKIAAAAEAEAKKNNWHMVIAIVDDGGHLVYLQRLDDTQTGSVTVGIEKARAAAAFRRPTKVMEDALVGGRMAILGIPGFIPSEGGIPLVSDGKVIGAIGVSGGTAAQDGQVGQAGAAALTK